MLRHLFGIGFGTALLAAAAAASPADIEQINPARVAGNRVTIAQGGAGNSATVVQGGNGNSVSVTQSGASSQAGILQSGAANSAAVTQQGASGNILNLWQDGGFAGRTG